MEWKEEFYQDPVLTELVGKIIQAYPNALGYIPPDKVIVVREINTKPVKFGMAVMANIRWAGPWLPFVPYWYVITVFERNTEDLSANAMKVLLFHELRHISRANMKIQQHDVQDFRSVLIRWGIDWVDDPNLPDILEVTDDTQHDM